MAIMVVMTMPIIVRGFHALFILHPAGHALLPAFPAIDRQQWVVSRVAVFSVELTRRLRLTRNIFRPLVLAQT